MDLYKKLEVIDLIQGHLRIEQVLSESIEATLVVPAALDIEKMRFSSKLRLAQALGVLQAADAAPFSVLNKLRNKAAHRQDFIPGPIDYKVLQNAFPTEMRMFLHEYLKAIAASARERDALGGKSPPQATFQQLVEALVLWLKQTCKN